MDARGATIEARLDKGRGAVATVLVQSGTLHVGDSIVAGTSYGRVRAMLDENGSKMKTRRPVLPGAGARPTSVPTAGDLFLVAGDDRAARQIAEKRQATERAAQLAKRRKDRLPRKPEGAVRQVRGGYAQHRHQGRFLRFRRGTGRLLMKIEVSDEVGIQVIHRGVGAITQNDVNLATVDKAVIIGFNVRPNRQVADLAEREGVEIKYYSIIYKAIEDIEASLKGHAEAGIRGGRHLPLRDPRGSSVPPSSATSPASWCRTARSSVVRSAVFCATAWLPSTIWRSPLRRFKDDVQSVKEGYEAGINPRQLQRHRDRRHHRDLRDARDRA